jgi:hypothetical protein
VTRCERVDRLFLKKKGCLFILSGHRTAAELYRYRCHQKSNDPPGFNRNQQNPQLLYSEITSTNVPHNVWVCYLKLYFCVYKICVCYLKFCVLYLKLSLYLCFSMSKLLPFVHSCYWYRPDNCLFLVLHVNSKYECTSRLSTLLLKAIGPKKKKKKKKNRAGPCC